MKVINPIGRKIVSETDANYEGITPAGGCICYSTSANATAKGPNFLCIGCRSNCFTNNKDNNAANQALAVSKTIL